MEKQKGINEADYVTLKVKDQDGGNLFVKMKRNTPMKKLMAKYCSEKGANLHSFVFLFEGKQLPPYKTPDQLNLKHLDEIDAMAHQIGGSVSVLSDSCKKP